MLKPVRIAIGSGDVDDAVDDAIDDKGSTFFSSFLFSSFEESSEFEDEDDIEREDLNCFESEEADFLTDDFCEEEEEEGIGIARGMD